MIKTNQIQNTPATYIVDVEDIAKKSVSDSTYETKSNASATYVKKTGDTLSGNLRVVSASPTITVDTNTSGQPNIDFAVNGVLRNRIAFDSNSNFRINWYSSTGVYEKVLYIDEISTLGGVGQTWKDVTTTKLNNVEYTNTTGRPIVVTGTATGGSNAYLYIYVNNLLVVKNGNTSTGNMIAGGTIIVPNNSTYKVNVTVGTYKQYHLS